MGGNTDSDGGLTVSGAGVPSETVVVRESGEFGVPIGGISRTCV